MIVAARTSPEKKARGITLFGVEAGMEGFSRGRKLRKVGQPESDTAELFFEDVRVPGANLIGEIDGGFIPHDAVAAAGAARLPVANVAHAAQILEDTLEYARDRKAFGQPIGKFQNTQFLLAELVTKIEVAQAFIDQAVAAHVKGKLTPIDAAKAKWWSADVQNACSTPACSSSAATAT